MPGASFESRNGLADSLAGHDFDGRADRSVLFDVLFDQLEDPRRTLIGHQAAGDLEMRLGRGDGLAPFAGETAPDAVEVDGGPGPAQLLHGVARFAKDGGDAGFLHELLVVAAFGYRRDIGAFLVGQGAHVVVEAIDGDRAVWVVERGGELGDGADGVGHGRAIGAGVEVGRAGRQIDLAADQTLEADGERRLVRRPSCRRHRT